MANFVISNKITDTTEIDIFGDIGMSWFGEGITFESIKAELSTITTPKIKLNISSLGGDVNDALVIYNLIKTSPAYVEANIMGFTASSATIIAMSADVVTMDENASFLIHNAWTGVNGNQHDLREVADTLEVLDNRLASIYKDKTGNRKDSILKLMKEERWLSASEAKELGFIDKVYKPMKAAAHYKTQIESINNSNYLPTIMNENQMNELKSGFMNEVKSFVSELFEKKNKEVSDESLNNAVEAQVSNKFEELTKAHNEKVSVLNAEIESFKNKVSELEAEIAKNAMKPTEVKAEIETVIIGSEKANEKTESQKMLEGFIQNNMTSNERMLLKLKK